MIRLLAPLAALALLAPAPARAAEPAVSGPCSQGSCAWFRVLADHVETVSPRGTLHRLRVRWWDTADPRGRGESRARAGTSYVLCSGERPLDPGVPTPTGADRGALALYAFVCHGMRIGGAESPDLVRLYPRAAQGREARHLARPAETMR